MVVISKSENGLAHVISPKACTLSEVYLLTWERETWMFKSLKSVDVQLKGTQTKTSNLDVHFALAQLEEPLHSATLPVSPKEFVLPCPSQQ